MQPNFENRNTRPSYAFTYGKHKRVPEVEKNPSSLQLLLKYIVLAATLIILIREKYLTGYVHIQTLGRNIRWKTERKIVR